MMMPSCRYCVFALLSCSAWAADQQLTVPAGAVAETRILLSIAEIKSKPVLWVQADPNQIEVSLIAPDGRKWTSKDYRESGAIVVQLADSKSGSSDEVFLAKMLGANATLVHWNPAAAPGNYRLQLSGLKLTAARDVIVRRLTSAEFAREAQSSMKRGEEDALSALFLAPERRIRLDAQGKASLTLEQRNWEREDVVQLGTTLGRNFRASLTLPDGSVVTEESARSIGCQWQKDSKAFLNAPAPHLSVVCAAHMKTGTISIAIDAGAQNQSAEMAVSVIRPKMFTDAIEVEDRNRQSRVPTIELVHKVSPEPGEQIGFATVTEGRTVKITVTPSGGAERVNSITVNAQPFSVDQKDSYRFPVSGPDRSKAPVGQAHPVQRGADGGYTYTFAGTKAGPFQVDFTANGTFANGRRFTATAGVRVLVLHLFGTVNGIRQQRLDVNNDGRADIARFLLNVDIRRAGRYEATIELGPSRTEHPAWIESDLAVGKQVVTVEGDREFLEILDKNPQARLFLRMTKLNTTAKDEPPGNVPIDMELPKAGAFALVNPMRGDTRASGAGWRLADTDGNGIPDRIAVSSVVSGRGTNCIWRAWMEVDPKTSSGTISTVGYQQRGTFVFAAGQAKIETLWDPTPFFPSGAAGKHAFVFRMMEARCGADDDARFDESLSFTADLTGVEIAHGRTNTGTGVPRLAGTILIEPLDKDRDGRFDHLKASFDIVSPGGTCIWRTGLHVSSGDNDHTAGHDGSAVTKPGTNRVSMEMDAARWFTLRDHPLFRFLVDRIRCGAQPEFTQKDLEEATIQESYLFEQEYAIQSNQFAKLGEFKVPPAPAEKKPRVDVRAYFPSGGGPSSGMVYPPQVTDKHGLEVAIKVSDGTERVGIVDKAMAQVYTVDFNVMGRLKLRPATGPSAAKKAIGSPIPMHPLKPGIFEFEFAPNAPGLYQIDFDVSGKLQNQQPFHETSLTVVQVRNEDLRVTALQQKALDRNNDGKPDEAVAAISLESTFDGDIEITAGLFKPNLLEQITPDSEALPPRLKVKKGMQTLTIPLPKESLAYSATNVLLVVEVRPVRYGEPDRGATYWDPGTAEWTNARSGFFHLVLQYVKAPAR